MVNTQCVRVLTDDVAREVDRLLQERLKVLTEGVREDVASVLVDHDRIEEEEQSADNIGELIRENGWTVDDLDVSLDDIAAEYTIAEAITPAAYIEHHGCSDIAAALVENEGMRATVAAIASVESVKAVVKALTAVDAGSFYEALRELGWVPKTEAQPEPPKPADPFINGLTWRVCANGAPLDYDDALAHIDAALTNGEQGWRLPTMNEMRDCWTVADGCEMLTRTDVVSWWSSESYSRGQVPESWAFEPVLNGFHARIVQHTSETLAAVVLVRDPPTGMQEG